MVERWVIDCLAMASVILVEEQNTETIALLEEALAGKARIIVPSLFWIEMGNVLVVAARKQRIDEKHAHIALGRLNELPINTDATGGMIVYRRILDFAIKHRLTFYDATYLELADRIPARLKTLDDDLLDLCKTYPWIR